MTLGHTHRFIIALVYSALILTVAPLYADSIGATGTIKWVIQATHKNDLESFLRSLDTNSISTHSKELKDPQSIREFLLKIDLDQIQLDDHGDDVADKTSKVTMTAPFKATFILDWSHDGFGSYAKVIQIQTP